jgi:hypothetical protein
LRERGWSEAGRQASRIKDCVANRKEGMESTAFFETKVSLSPKDLNGLSTKPVEELLLDKVRAKLEDKCTSNGFVLPGTLKVLSRSVGYFEAARFTGDAVYYVKSEGRVLYPADGVRIIGEIVRKNKMGMYVIHRDAIRIQIPRDLHLGNEEYEEAQIGDKVEVELKRSKFQVNDTFILATGLFVRLVKDGTGTGTGAVAVEKAEEQEEEQEQEEEEQQEEQEEQEEAETSEETTAEEEEEE